MPDLSVLPAYIRLNDGAPMIEIAPHWFVNAHWWRQEVVPGCQCAYCKLPVKLPVKKSRQ